MNTKERISLALALSTLLGAQLVLADDQPDKAAAKPPPARKELPKEIKPTGPLQPGPAVIRQNNVNMRGQASINSEVIARLKKGDTVNVIEEITVPRPKTDEPPRWAKVALPSQTAVWASTLFIDPATKTVKVNRLNLRSGPGENYSVVGRIDKGTVVKEIETKGNWMKIEPPAGAYGFVAAQFLVQEKEAPAIAAVKPEPTPPPPATPPTPPPATPPPAPVETVVVPPPPPTPEPVAVTPPTPPPAAPPPVAPPVIVGPPPITPAKPAPPPAEEETWVKRVVTREGVVKRSVSIQAPTYFVLESLDNRKTINYLFSPSTNIVLKDFKGQRIIVTGEESLDERWTTPVLTVDTLQTVE